MIVCIETTFEEDISQYSTTDTITYMNNRWYDKKDQLLYKN